MNNGKGGSSRVFLLSCWQNQDPIAGLSPQWHCSVEELHGDQYQLECSSLGKLVARLRVELDRGARELAPHSSNPEE